MRSERLRLKDLGKSGDKSASFQEKALKVLINGSYGFFGTGYYSFNDYEAAALVTAYGRKILNLMVSVVESCGGITIEIDTDGIFFSHTDPETVAKAVADALPDGIEIELELKHCGLYAPKAKSYVLVSPEGKTSVKGLFRKRNRYSLQNEFLIEFIRLYFTQGLSAADDYYQDTRAGLVDSLIPVEQLIITRKIGKAEKNLVELGIGNVGDRVSYWYKKLERYHSKTGKPLKTMPVETNSGEYWSEYYVADLDEAYAEIILP
jgi:DNA polymerase, archaea type